MADTWIIRDYPILLRTAELLEELPPGRPLDARRSDFAPHDPDDVFRALLALQAGGYVEVTAHKALGGVIIAFQVDSLTERGRRATNLWPSEPSAEALIQALQRASDEEPDPAKKSVLKRTAEALAGGGRDLVVDIASAVIRSQAGLP